MVAGRLPTTNSPERSGLKLAKPIPDGVGFVHVGLIRDGYIERRQTPDNGFR